MATLMLTQWNRNRYICENFSPARDAAECTGTKFYHWGALLGLIAMEEQGLYNWTAAGSAAPSP